MKKFFLILLFRVCVFLRTLAACVLSPWLWSRAFLSLDREHLSSEGLSLALASSLVFSTQPLVGMLILRTSYG